MEKIITVLGTRPEIIRLSLIIKKLDKVSNHILVHTGQNYDNLLSQIFFDDLGIRSPDYYLGVRGSPGEQIGLILQKTEEIFLKEKPDKILILGDTNSGLCSIVAARMGIPVYHMEAGNRCGDVEVPEEVNRKIIDHISTYNFPYTPGSRENLLKEGIDKNKILMSGNPIYEVITTYEEQISQSKILSHYVSPYPYFLVTFHRSECVDIPRKLNEILKSLTAIADQYEYPVIVSVHPRTRDKLERHSPNLSLANSLITFLEPLRFFDFVYLEKNALCIISDSGTCCEEGTILGTPTVICRETTERPEVIEAGSAMVSGINAENIVNCVSIMKDRSNWDMPIGYMDKNVSDKIVQYLLGKI